MENTESILFAIPLVRKDQTMLKRPSTPLALAAALFLQGINHSAAQPFLNQAPNLSPTEHERQMVTKTNSAYYEAFNQTRENNWVLQKIDAGNLQRGCWLDQDTLHQVGAEQVFEGLTMKCIEIGKSTRIFWPSRWVAFCQTTGLDYGRCLVERFNPN
jgi:hypothetical protein